MRSHAETVRAMREEHNRIDEAIASERQAITELRGLLMVRRPVVPPSRSMGRPTAVDFAAVRAALLVHQAALTRLEVCRDWLESQLGAAKAGQ